MCGRNVFNFFDHCQYTMYIWLYRSVPSMYFVMYAHVSESRRDNDERYFGNFDWTFVISFHCEIGKISNCAINVCSNHPLISHMIWKSRHSNVGCRWIFPYFSINVFLSPNTHYAFVIRTVFATIDQIDGMYWCTSCDIRSVLKVALMG